MNNSPLPPSVAIRISITVSEWPLIYRLSNFYVPDLSCASLLCARNSLPHIICVTSIGNPTSKDMQRLLYLVWIRTPFLVYFENVSSLFVGLNMIPDKASPQLTPALFINAHLTILLSVLRLAQGCHIQSNPSIA